MGLQRCGGVRVMVLMNDANNYVNNLPYIREVGPRHGHFRCLTTKIRADKNKHARAP